MKGKRMEIGSLYWQLCLVPAWMVSMVVLATITENMVAQQAGPTLAHSTRDKRRDSGDLPGQSRDPFAARAVWTPVWDALFADAVLALMRQESLKPTDVIAIGCHGQTVWHEPAGRGSAHTPQIGDNEPDRRPHPG